MEFSTNFAGQSNVLLDKYDLVIVGAGPAGLTAAIYSSRAMMDCVVLEKNVLVGGQIANTESVENYPGFPESVGGFEIMQKFREQAEKFGAKITTATVERILRDGNGFRIITDIGETVASIVIAASGASPRKMGIKGEEQLIGKGVSFCATCDGALYKGKTVAVIGGGDAGIEEGLFLTRFAEKVIVIEVMDHLGATKVLQRRARENKNIEILLSHKPTEIVGDGVVEGIIVKNLADGTLHKIDVDGIFVYIGIEPNVDFIAMDDLEQDRSGFIITDDAMSTNIPGFFAAGDVRSKLLRQLSTAVGDGATAAFAAEKLLERL